MNKASDKNWEKQSAKEWESVIGLEIHVQLMTRSKLFSGAATAYGAAPNAQACAIDLGLPGVLPVLNESALRMAIKLGLSIGAHIAPKSVFARKNYFYPDLPKGYQISQFEYPIVSGGTVLVTLDDGTTKSIGITRAHLEEDAGKSLHEAFNGYSGIDLNRAGIPLIEIVSNPELRSAKEAVAYLKTIHTLVRYLEISDGNLQEGSFRCDANVSVRPKGETAFGTRAEIKNVNSFRFVEKAINYEIKRQIDILENHGTIVQETRLYDANKDETRPMRAKEEANDYRYFPDPDLLPILVDNAFIEHVRKTLPELPREKCERFMHNYGLNAYDANVLTSAREIADFFEATLKAASEKPSHALALPEATAKLCANWVMGDLSGALNKAAIEITHSPITPNQLGTLVKRIQDKTVSGKIAKTIFETLWQSIGENQNADIWENVKDFTWERWGDVDAILAKQGLDVDAIIEKQGLQQVTDIGAIEAIVDQVIAANLTQAANYKNGQEKLLGFFVGQVMKASQGKANPDQVNEILKRKLA